MKGGVYEVYTPFSIVFLSYSLLIVEEVQLTSNLINDLLLRLTSIWIEILLLVARCWVLLLLVVFRVFILLLLLFREA